MRPHLLLLVSGLLLPSACGNQTPPLRVVSEDPSDVPLHGATSAQRARFDQGDTLFDLVFRDPDGLGPVYIRTSCSACHAGAARGPGSVQKFGLVEVDGITPAPDQSFLAFGHTVRPFTGGGATTPLLAPTGGFPAGTTLRTSVRIGPAVFARGYLEAVDPSELLRVEAEQGQRSDGIHGRINRVTYHSQLNPDALPPAYSPGETGLLGRFGLKARIATLDDFVADAFQGDMGLTSPLRPTELPDPDGLTDDAKPGVDLTLDLVNQVASYLRLLELPSRDAELLAGPGPALFQAALCSVCHVPSLRTRVDYPEPQLAGIDAPLYSDLLLHDMGESLADGLVDESAGPSEWKTPTLIGLRFQRTLLHDGRATTVEMAVLAHAGPGSQANESVQRFQALTPADRQALLDFVESL